MACWSIFRKYKYVFAICTIPSLWNDVCIWYLPTGGCRIYWSHTSIVIVVGDLGTQKLRASLAMVLTYHGYAMRKILPLCIKTVTCKSKDFLCLFGHISRIHCFWLKNLNLFSQNITFRVINYLNLVEKIIRNWNVDEVSVPIISKDIR